MNRFFTIVLIFSFTLIDSGFSQNRDSLDLKIGQMIMVGINQRTEVTEQDSLLQEIRNNKLGGIILFEKNIAKQNSREQLKKLISTLKSNTRIPLLVSIDEEGGKVHRLKEKYGFVGMPSAAYLGSINQPDSTLYYNCRLAEELYDLGINFNYAPCVDLAINPENDVIVNKNRSFSNSPQMVADHARLCILAHRDNQVKTILKHFPGHGSSTGDSHLGIVDVTNTWSFTELLPYYHLIQSNHFDAIMTAHIINRNWDTSSLPATLSEKVVTGILRGLLGFKGVVFSDDMQMYAISKNYGLEHSIELAINAGVDVLVFGNNVSQSDRPITGSEMHAIIKKLVLDGKISRARIDEAYRRIIELKQGIN